MKRSNLGNLFIVFLVCLTVVVWLVFPPVNDGREKFIRQYAGEIIGSINIVLMACSLTLAARPKWAEPYFGGLDKMYVTHRHTSTAALLLIFVHVLTVPISLSGWALGNYLAVIAFTGIVAIALVSLSPRIPFLNRITGGTYEGWKNLKKYVGIFFILAFIHSLTIRDPLDAFIAINYVQVFFIIGTVAYLQTQFFGRFFKKHIPYTVEQVSHPTNFTTEVTLRAKDTPIAQQRAGQFIFVRFPGEKNLNESHPFTISSAPHEDVLRLTIKASGDFTRALFNELKPGADAIVEGAHGMFDFKNGGQKQIWIAGGIGVTPFLAWLEALQARPEQAPDVDFYYSVREHATDPFVARLQALCANLPAVRLHVISGARNERLTAATLRDRPRAGAAPEIWFCGPRGLATSLRKGLRRLGMGGASFHQEAFEMR